MALKLGSASRGRVRGSMVRRASTSGEENMPPRPPPDGMNEVHAGGAHVRVVDGVVNRG
jgi:hypothetical protein